MSEITVVVPESIVDDGGIGPYFVSQAKVQDTTLPYGTMFWNGRKWKVFIIRDREIVFDAEGEYDHVLKKLRQLERNCIVLTQPEHHESARRLLAKAGHEVISHPPHPGPLKTNGWA